MHESQGAKAQQNQGRQQASSQHEFLEIACTHKPETHDSRQLLLLVPSATQHLATTNSASLTA